MSHDPELVAEVRGAAGRREVAQGVPRLAPVPLTEFAWRFRYPGEPEDPTPEEAEDALATAREVYEAIATRLPEELRP